MPLALYNSVDCIPLIPTSVCSFKKCLFSALNELNNVLGSEIMSKINKYFCPCGVYILIQEAHSVDNCSFRNKKIYMFF